MGRTSNTRAARFPPPVRVFARACGGWHAVCSWRGASEQAEKGSVLDVEMTILDKQSKSVPIDEQANDDVVHLYRFQIEEARIRAAYAKRQKADARYSSFNRGHLFLMQEREQCVLTLLHRGGFAPLQATKILDVGCGTGYWLRAFIQWGARPDNLTGIDLLVDHLTDARALCPEAVTLVHGNAAALDFPDATFDLVVQSTVFTSVLDANMKHQMAAEMLRVVKDDGGILWYDFSVNNPWNPDVRGVKRREIAHLFPGCRMKLQRLTLVPPLVRLLAPYSWFACYVLGKIPWLCTHYLGLISKELGPTELTVR
jgi:ubiquinone/menaquinone biosynthesis C-methylase UbiE